MNDKIRQQLVNTLTEYDIRESKKRFYNPYALGQYFMALQRVEEDMQDGCGLTHAIGNQFVGPLRVKLLKAVGNYT